MTTNTGQPLDGPERWAAGVESPAASVVVPTRGRPRMLAEAVQSILDQRYDGLIECLVVFDQQEVVPPPIWVPPNRRLRLLQNTRVPGAAGARNTGLEQARGRLVAFCDDDDRWQRDKLSRQWQMLQAVDHALLVTCGITVHSPEGQVVRLPAADVYTLDDVVASRNAVIHPSTFLAWREAVLERVGLFDEAIPGSYGEDYDWLIRVAAQAPVAAVKESLVDVRWGGSSWFAERWELITEALAYLLAHRPELQRNRANLARMHGQVAFAHAALGQRSRALRWARSSFRYDWRQPRSYLALLVASGILDSAAVIRALRRRGRGI
ncbi:MAG: glycosyltransferase family 2 protein [Pseudonocardiaceae bacterium]